MCVYPCVTRVYIHVCDMKRQCVYMHICMICVHVAACMCACVMYECVSIRAYSCDVGACMPWPVCGHQIFSSQCSCGL